MDKYDLNKLDPNTIITSEMLNPVETERFMVITNYKKSYEVIKYNGTSEIEAYVKYKETKHNDKMLVSANVVQSDLFQDMYGVEFILDYKIIEVIAGKKVRDFTAD